MNSKSPVEKRVREIKRRTRRKYNVEEKIRIALEGFKGETTVAELCRREGINQNTYYRWSKDFMEAGKKRLKGDTEREATTVYRQKPLDKYSQPRKKSLGKLIPSV